MPANKPLLPRKPDATHTHRTVHGDDHDHERGHPRLQLRHPVYAHTDNIEEYAFSPFCLSSTSLNLSLTSPARTLDPKNPSSAVVRRTSSTTGGTSHDDGGGEGEETKREGGLGLTTSTTATSTTTAGGDSRAEMEKPPSERSTTASTSTSSSLQRTRRALLSGVAGEKERNPLKWICRRSDPTPQSTPHLQDHSTPSQSQLLQQHILQQLCLERLEKVEKLLQGHNAQHQPQQIPPVVVPPPAPGPAPSSSSKQEQAEGKELLRRVEAENARLRETITLMRQENKGLERMNAALSERGSMLSERERVLEEQVIAAREELIATREEVIATREEVRCGREEVRRRQEEDEKDALHERNRCLERRVGEYTELSTQVEVQREMLIQTAAVLGRAGEQNRALRKTVQGYTGKTQELEQMIAVLEGEWERVVSDMGDRKSRKISMN